MDKRFSAPGGYQISARDVMRGIDTADKVLGRTQRIASQVDKAVSGDAEAIRSLYSQGRTGYNMLRG